MKDMIIRFRRSANYHLGALSRRNKFGSMAVFYYILAIFLNSGFNKPHWFKYVVLCFIRRKAYKRFFGRKFDVDAHSVRKKPKPVGKNRVRPGNCLCVDVTCKTIFLTEKPQSFYHVFHGPIRSSNHRGRKKKPFDVSGQNKGENYDRR